MSKMDHFPQHRDFRNLTISDLLAAREAWHTPLTNMHNVVGTAIGLYRFRKEDKGKDGQVKIRKKGVGPRTFDNSEVRQDSFPCVLVLVSHWQDLSKFGDNDPAHYSLAHLVPQLLYTSSGLVVPTCVVLVNLADQVDRSLSRSEYAFPDNFLGGGSPLMTVVQGETHLGTAGCLVTDGERRYVLTARHVAGVPGLEVFSTARGKRRRVGVTSSKQVVRRPFKELYPSWEQGDVEAMLDAALVEIDDVQGWTSRIYQMSDLQNPADLNVSNINLSLIGTQLVAYGARSRLMKGEIHALFPRYSSISGLDYVADFLVGPREGTAFTPGPGDSGALWAVESTKGIIPLGLNWGALSFLRGQTPTEFALGTFLSNISEALAVDVETGHNRSFLPVWGKAKHENFAGILCTVLGSLADDNALANFLIKGSDTDARETVNALYRELAYVPDKWKQMGRGKEGPNHYANIDLLGEDGKRQLADIKPDPQAWLDFYKTSPDPSNRGAIPFRIGQIFELMQQLLQNKQYDEFVCAAGVLMHYAADACNPAHVTRWGRGNPNWEKNDRSSFHSLWDSAAYDSDRVVSEVVKQAKTDSKLFKGKNEVITAVLGVMNETLGKVDLQPYADGVEASEGRKAAKDYSQMESCQEKIAFCVTSGAVLWWRIVSSLWSQYGDSKNAKWNEAVDMKSIYTVKEFLVSVALDQY